jgi:hypothetical protein
LNGPVPTGLLVGFSVTLTFGALAFVVGVRRRQETQLRSEEHGQVRPRGAEVHDHGEVVDGLVALDRGDGRPREEAGLDRLQVPHDGP